MAALLESNVPLLKSEKHTEGGRQSRGMTRGGTGKERERGRACVYIYRYKHDKYWIREYRDQATARD